MVVQRTGLDWNLAMGGWYVRTRRTRLGYSSGHGLMVVVLLILRTDLGCRSGHGLTVHRARLGWRSGMG